MDLESYDLFDKNVAKPAKEQFDDTYSDCVDWDIVHEKYHHLIIGPWSSVMTRPDPNKNNKIRNHLLNRLLTIDRDDTKNMRILDYGCGPGNLLEHLAGKIDAVYGLDISPKALEIAYRKSKNFGIRFIPLNGDMRHFTSAEKFDLIISSNSILPQKRSDIILMLKSVRNNLNVNGRFIAILPSFDTCVAIASYLEEACKNQGLAEEVARRRVADFEEKKKMNYSALSFADDGVHAQCFHTPDSIKREFSEAGLKIICSMKKVEYPWEYARRFDYGYFPEKPEIWDWFIEAERDV